MDIQAWWATVYGVAESDMTEWLNWIDGEKIVIFSPHGEKVQFLYSMDGSDKELEKKSLISQTYNEEMV